MTGDQASDQPSPQAPPSLRAFQTWMQSFIVHPGTPEQALAAAEELSGVGPRSAQRLVKPSATLNEMERLMIYRRMYPLRMEEALSIDFPATRQLLGEKRFSRLVADYIEVHPSTSWTLDHLGAHLVDYVRTHALGQEFPGLYDLVCLEQALCEVFNELDSAVLTPEELSGVPADQWLEVRLEFIPALRLLRLSSNANATYRAHLDERPLPEFRAEPQQLVVWRNPTQTWRMPLPATAYGLLQALRDGRSLGDALELVLHSHDLPEEQLFEWFSHWVGEGFFCSLIVK